MMPDEGG